MAFKDVFVKETKSDWGTTEYLPCGVLSVTVDKGKSFPTFSPRLGGLIYCCVTGLRVKKEGIITKDISEECLVEGAYLEIHPTYKYTISGGDELETARGQAIFLLITERDTSV